MNTHKDKGEEMKKKNVITKCACQCHPPSISGFKHQYPVGDKRKKTVCPCCMVYEADFDYPIEGDYIKISMTKWQKIKKNIRVNLSRLIKRIKESGN